MGITLIENLVQIGQSLTGKVYRAIAGTDSNGNAVPFSSSTNGALITQTSTDSNGSFGRFRVSTPVGLFANTTVFDKQPLIFDESLSVPVSMSSTFNSNQASVTLQINSGVGSNQSIVRQSFQYVPYQPGMSQILYLTATFGTATANATKEIGIFDANDGLFFQQNGSGTISVVVRTSTSGTPVDTTINQSSWNLDPMNGSGPSGVTLDPNDSQVFVIDFAWLGVGMVRFGFAILGETIWVHQVQNANTISTVYMKRGSLPVRYSIRTTGTLAANATLTCICAAVISDGVFELNEIPAGTNTDRLIGASISVSAAAFRPILTIQLKSSYNRGLIIPIEAGVTATSANLFSIYLVLGGTLSGGVPTTTSVSNAVEAITGRTTLTGGTILRSAFGGGSSERNLTLNLPKKILAAANISGTTQQLHLVVMPTSNTNFYGHINWNEVY